MTEEEFDILSKKVSDLQDTLEAHIDHETDKPKDNKVYICIGCGIPLAPEDAQSGYCLACKPEPEVCEWKGDGNHWDTGCGCLVVNYGRYPYCPFCAKPTKEKT